MEIALLCTMLVSFIVGIGVGRGVSTLTEEEMIRRIRKLRFEQRIKDEVSADLKQELNNL